MERRFIFLKTSTESQLSENFILEADKHIGKCFKSCTSGSWKPSALSSSQLQFCVLQPGVQDVWKPHSINDQDRVNLSNSSSHNESQLDELADQIHSCLDLLPAPGTHLLDILWFCDAPPREFPAALYGALKRCVAWHGAMLSVITEEHTGLDVPPWFVPLRAEILPMSMLCNCHSLSEFLCPDLVWRGSLAFYNHEDLDVFKIHGFELHAARDVFDWSKGEETTKINTGVSSRTYFSGSLEVVSEVPLNSVPPHLLTKDKLVLKTSTLGDDDILASDFMSETFPTPNSAIVVKLKFSMDKPRIDAKKLKTDHWKSEVNYNLDPSPPCQSMGEDVSSVSLLVFDDPDASEDCTRNVLQKSAVVFKNVQEVSFASSLKEITHEGEVRSDTEKIAAAKDLINFPKFHVDESKIEVVKNYVNEVQVEVINALTQENNDLIQNNSIEDVRIAITTHLMKTLNFPVMFTSVEEGDFSYPEPRLKTVNPDDWQEARFLAFLQKHHDKAERQIRDSQPSKQVKDYVLLEAKELLKFFNEDGLAAKVEDLELIEAKNRNCPLRPQKSEKDYEQFFKENFKKVTHDYSGFEFTGNYKDFTKVEFTQHPDVYYNNGEKAETYDKECAKMHLFHVGLTRETASTFVSGPDTERLPVAPRHPVPAGEPNKENQIRRSPRKKLAPPKRPGLVAKKSPKMDKSGSVNKGSSRPQAVRNLQLAKKPTKSPVKKSAPLKPLQNKLNPKANGASNKNLGSVPSSKPAGQPSKPLLGKRTEAVKGTAAPAQKVETPEEANVKKLRVSVYAALTQEGVAEKDSIFKPCFRKLFNMCKMCLQDAMSKRDDSIADMMYDMAKMNVKNVIKMEKMTRK